MLAVVPESEREFGSAIVQQLSSLYTRIREFAHALELLAMCHKWMAEGRASRPTTSLSSRQMIEAEERLIHWQLMALREGARVLYLVEITMSNLKGQLIPKCKSINSLLQHRKKDEAATAFRRAFPDFAPVRHAGAHSDELINHPDKLNDHSMQGPYSAEGIDASRDASFYVGEIVRGSRYSTTFKGRMRGYELSASSLQLLSSAIEDYISAFDPVLDAAHRPSPS